MLNVTFLIRDDHYIFLFYGTGGIINNLHMMMDGAILTKTSFYQLREYLVKEKKNISFLSSKLKKKLNTIMHVTLNVLLVQRKIERKRLGKRKS